MIPARRSLLAWLALALLLAPLAEVGAQANAPPRMSGISSQLEPPFSHYSVETRDPDGDALTFTWTLTDAGACTTFTSQGPRASWQHDGDACPHDAPAHPGTIRVVVTDGHWNVTRVYTAGSAPHTAPSDWDRADYDAGPGSSTIASGSDGDDPRDATPPEVYGEEIDCAANQVVGAFQPAQAVWQDDHELFPDKPTKRFVTLEPTRHRAELDLAAGKPTALFGLHPTRGEIRFQGELGGYVAVPAEVQFKLRDAGGERVIHRHDAGMLPIRGECLGSGGFDIRIPTRLGVPVDAAFTVRAGAYTLTMDLVEKATQIPVPGARVVVEGRAVDVPKHRAYFVPVMLTDYTGAEAQSLVAAARGVAATYAAEVPDFFPLKAGDVSVVTRPIERDMRDVFAEAKQLCLDLWVRTREPFINCEPHAIRARIEGQMRAGAWAQAPVEAGQGGGAPDRIVVWIRHGDMDAFGRDTAQAFAPSTKTVFVRPDSDHWDVAHEIVHTLPRHLWSKDQMLSACSVDYHNLGAFASGPRLTVGGAESRSLFDKSMGLMGAVSATKTYWIEQCTYWHLLTALSQRVDPPLFAVRGVVASVSGEERGLLDPGFTFDGVPDLDEATEGAYALALVDAAGATLASYRFDLSFEDDREEPLPLVSFGFAVPRHDDAARIELRGPTGTLDAWNVTASKPVVTVTPPASQHGDVEVAWTGTDADGDALTYALFASPDGGASWFDVVVDTDATSATVPAALLDGEGPRLVRVVASDGVWSAGAVASLDPASGSEVEQGIPDAGALGALVVLVVVAAVADRARGFTRAARARGRRR
jgi:hypothetical protein